MAPREVKPCICEAAAENADCPAHSRTSDPVTRPRHYVATLADGREIECREVIRALGLNFALANVLKYLWRAGRKTPDRAQDLRKAADYLADEIDHG